MTKRVLDFDDENYRGADKGDGKEGKVKVSKSEKKRISEDESSEKKKKKRVKGFSKDGKSKEKASNKREEKEIIAYLEQLHAEFQRLLRVAEVENDDVFHDFIKDRENGDFVTKIIDSLWLRDVKHTVNVKTQLRSHSSQLYQESVDDESEGGFLKLKITSEWLLGDNTAPVNKKVIYEAEVIFLVKLAHPHLLKLLGYCCQDENRLLVYEYIAQGNLENHLFGRYSVSLPWLTRLKIALGAVKGLVIHATE
ncbi:hypothetical protein AgCh_023054 [Apium graveolens]